MARSARNPRVRVSSRTPHFFKVFFPDLSSEKLKIPPKFLKHLEGKESHDKVSLKGPSGSIWFMEAMRRSDGFFLDNGWKDFVTDHSLDLGDFLVFCYDGQLRFDVMVFDSSACEKEGSFLARPHQGVKEEEQSTDSFSARNPKRERESDDYTVQGNSRNKRIRCEGDSNKRSHARKGKISLTSLTTSHRAIHLENHMASSCKEQRDRNRMKNELGNKVISSHGYTKNRNKAKLESSRGREARCGTGLTTSVTQASSEKSNKSKPSALIQSCNKSSKNLQLPEASKMPKIEEDDEPSQNVRLWKPLKMPKVEEDDPPRNVKWIKYSKMPKTKEGIQIKKKNDRISKRRMVTNQELDNALEMSKLFKSRHPFFKVQMKNSFVYRGFFLNICARFSGKYLGAERRMMTLWDPMGRSWPVKFIPYENPTRGFFSAGWRKFVFVNNLENGDVCIFELFMENNFRVHIFRVVNEAVPFTPS